MPRVERPVPVVRLIVPDDAGRVLLLRRAPGTEAAGAWCLPGGKVDYGQAVERAAATELREETSLVCQDLRFLFYQDSLPPAPGAMHCINLYLECRASGNVRLNVESSAWARCGAEELGSYDVAFGNADALRRYWERG
jgi:8-oxo-dGTP pyrophosphatase MutT (NUDIX family)